MLEILNKWFIDIGVNETLANYLGWAAVVVIIFILAALSHFIAKKFFLTGISFLVKKSKTKWDDALLQRKVFNRLSHFAPALVIFFTAYLFGPVEDIIQRLAMVYMFFAGVLAVNSFLNAVVDIYRTYDISRQRPIKGYVQVAQIIMFILLGIAAIATLMNRSPWLILSGFGAMTAVILLIFKDSILGLVASVQLSGNDMVRIGDWIEMPKYGADGDVMDITLTTVKVQNWDKTITTIPAYSMISDSFKNWRGMSESGGRRIKRAIYIDMNSIKFCTPEMIEHYKKYQLLTDYIETKKGEIEKYNKEHNIDTSELINGRNMTNVGTFRAYIVAYLKNHPKIHQAMTFLIRHLPPGEKGLPIEIYVFSNDQVWANYEAIQADIFDHILAVAPMFDLRVFQNPSGSDFRQLTQPN